MKRIKWKTQQGIIRKLTQFVHCEGTTTSGWKTCAEALKRCQVHDYRQFGKRSWADYPSDRWGWVTDTGRLIGVGTMPTKNVLFRNEILIAVPIPFTGSGASLRCHAEWFVGQMNRAARTR